MKKKMSKPQAVDLFCGCGGISCGLERAGFDILSGIDNDAISLRSYTANFPKATAVRSDLSLLNPADVVAQMGVIRGSLDLLAGGPPCQGFSKNVPRKNRYREDPNNRLVCAFLEIASHLMPRFILMENVAEMRNGFERSYTNLVMDLLADCGYAVKHKILHAPDYGVPQRRRRAFFLASRDGEPFDFPAVTYCGANKETSLFESSSYVTVWDAIGDLPLLEHGEGTEPAEYPVAPFHPFQEWARNGSGQVSNHIARHLQPTQYERLAFLEPGQGIKDLPELLRPRTGYSGAYGRLTKEMVAPTITRWVFHPGSGRFGHPVNPRVITIREAARLQAFPDTFRFTGTYIQQSHQVGNAVPPLLAESIGKALLAYSSAGN